MLFITSGHKSEISSMNHLQDKAYKRYDELKRKGEDKKDN